MNPWIASVLHAIHTFLFVPSQSHSLAALSSFSNSSLEHTSNSLGASNEAQHQKAVSLYDSIFASHSGTTTTIGGAVLAAAETGNPWIDHLRHMYTDADHMTGLLPPLLVVVAITVVVTLSLHRLARQLLRHLLMRTRRRTHVSMNQQMPRPPSLSSILHAKSDCSSTGARDAYRQQHQQLKRTALLLLATAITMSSSTSNGTIEIARFFPTRFGSAGSGLADLIVGHDPRLQQVLALCPRLRRGPTPPPFWSNRHLQFVPWMVQNLLHEDGIIYESHDLVVQDCRDKSVRPCLPDPDMWDTIRLDVFPPWLSTTPDDDLPWLPPDAPVVLIAPGLRCNSRDLPGNTVVRTLYGRGIRTVVVQRRGHTLGRSLRAPRWNIFGDVDDLEAVYWHVRNVLLPRAVEEANRRARSTEALESSSMSSSPPVIYHSDHIPMLLHGISSGCAVVVSALAEWDKRARLQPHLPTPTFVAVTSLTPGYDIAKVMLPERFKWPYNALLTSEVKQHFLKQNRDLLRNYNATAYDAALAATSLQAFLNASTPFAGYPDPDSYYAHVNPVNDMQYVSTPLYILNAVDDPCCHVQNLYERSSLPAHKGQTYAELIAASARGMVAVAATGSHCPFLDGSWWPWIRDPLTGGIMLNSWADQSIAEFFVAALDVYEDRKFL